MKALKYIFGAVVALTCTGAMLLFYGYLFGGIMMLPGVAYLCIK